MYYITMCWSKLYWYSYYNRNFAEYYFVLFGGLSNVLKNVPLIINIQIMDKIINDEALQAFKDTTSIATTKMFTQNILNLVTKLFILLGIIIYLKFIL